MSAVLTWKDILPGDMLRWQRDEQFHMLVYRNADFTKSVWWSIEDNTLFHDDRPHDPDLAVAGSITVIGKQDAWY